MIKYGRFMGSQTTELAFLYFEFKLLTFPQSQMPDAIDSLCRHGVKIQAQVANLRLPLYLKYTSASGD